MMMRRSILLLSLTLSLLIPADQTQVGPDSAKNLIPQAQAVINWLQAVKEGDEKKLKEAFSERMRKIFDETGWDEVLKTYQQAFAKEFGDYRLEDFAFEYSGGELEGKVSIFYKDEKIPEVHGGGRSHGRAPDIRPLDLHR